jgi:UDP-N-acetyl-D-mannosaminuronic acid dehydrogenase
MKQDAVISVIGLGYIGLPTAATLANTGLRVIGVDVREDVVNTIRQGDIHISEQGLDILVRAAVQRKTLETSLTPQVADVHIIAVPTPITEDKQPDLSFVEAATHTVCQVLKPGDLVVLESTVPPGTCVNVVAPIIEKQLGLKHGADYHLAHCPERVIPGKILHEIIYNDRIIGGTTPEATERTAELYGTFVKGKLLTTNATTAELCKLMENTYRDVNIALANELASIAEDLDVNITEAIALANHHPRVNLHTPGIGVGGHCIPVDPWFIVHTAPEKATIIHAARRTNDARPNVFAGRIAQLIREHPDRQVALLGLSYKADVDDTRESPATQIVLELASQTSVNLWVVEPHITVLPKALSNLSNLTLVDEDTAYRKADILVMLVPHSNFLKAQKKLLYKKIVDVAQLPARMETVIY